MCIIPSLGFPLISKIYFFYILGWAALRLRLLLKGSADEKGLRNADLNDVCITIKSYYNVFYLLFLSNLSLLFTLLCTICFLLLIANTYLALNKRYMWKTYNILLYTHPFHAEKCISEVWQS